MITVELVKLLRRPRTWISVLLTCALPFVVAVFITVTHLGPPPGQGSAFLSAVLQDGALYPAAALALVLPVFLPVAVAVVAGDSIAGEATGGTLRYLLVRPVGRTRLLVAKLVSVIAYVLLVVLAVTFTAYATGVFLLGPSQAAAVGQAPGGAGLPGVSAGRGPGGGRGGHVAIRRAAQPAPADRTDRGRHRLHHRVDARRSRDRAVPVHHHRFGPRFGVRRAGRAGGQRGAGDAQRGHCGPALPADPVLAGLDRLLPAARLLARYPAGVRHSGGLRGGVPGCRVGELLHQGHHRLKGRRASCSPGTAASACGTGTSRWPPAGPGAGRCPARRSADRFPPT